MTLRIGSLVRAPLPILLAGSGLFQVATAEFVDVTSFPTSQSAPTKAIAWGDFDGDDDPDLLVANSGANGLLRNALDGAFLDVAVAGPLGDIEWTLGAAWADHDNDGDLDVVISNDFDSVRLLRNDGGITFTDVTRGDLRTSVNHTNVTWADYDRDGDVDLYVAAVGENKLYRNDGDNTFFDVTEGPEGDPDLGIAGIWADYDGDLDPDLYVVNHGGANRLLRNDDGVFADVTAGAVGDQGLGYAAAWGDYDNDGDPDLFLGNQDQSNHLFRNDGGDVFADVTPIELVDTGAGASSVNWIDVDNDGDLDLFAVSRSQGNRLFRNDGGGGWVDVAEAPLARMEGSRSLTDGLAANPIGTSGRLTDPNADPDAPARWGQPSAVSAWADYDLDGDLDLYLGRDQSNSLFRNELVLDETAGFLHLTLEGSASNRAAIGAQVRVVVDGVSQLREVSGGGTWSQPSLTVEFGLGSAAWVDTLEIRWPSGIRQLFTGLPPNQRMEITEAATPWSDASTGPLADAGSGQGVAWGDFDDDGDPDLYLTSQSFDEFPSKLFRNDGGAGFVDITTDPLGRGTSAGRTGYPPGGVASAWGDYDNDGDLDLYRSYLDEPGALLRNDGGQTFADVTTGRLGGPPNMKGVAWGDFDNDGDLDLCQMSDGDDNVLLRNDGDDVFTDLTPNVLEDNGPGQCVAWGDYDDDGDLDLAITNFHPDGAVRLLRNDGPRNQDFVEIDLPLPEVPSGAPGRAGSVGANGIEWGDYDNDGDLDLVVARSNDPSRLFRNEGGDVFTGGPALPYERDDRVLGTAFGDYDNDGDLDLYLTLRGRPNRLLRNDDGTFVRDLEGPLGDTERGAGAAWADHDLDGDLDLYLVNDGAGINRLYRNDRANGNHWLQVNLEGVGSNRSGIGARIRLVVGSRIMAREVSGGAGYLSQGPLTAAFGLGGATIVDSLVVRWPSRMVQVLTNVSADQILTVTEPPPAWTSVPDPVVTASTTGQGVAWGDYDSDGDPDLFVADRSGENGLFRNDAGTFVEVTPAGLADPSGDTWGATWGDYDNDGDADLFTASSSGENHLYRNDGGDAFADVTTTLLADADAHGRIGTWVDYDRDGDLDLYVVNRFDPNKLYHNDGGTFIATVAGPLNHLAGNNAAVWGDYDDDGDVDVYLASHNDGDSRLIRNEGGGTFVDVTSGPLARVPADGGYGRRGISDGANGAAWGDYDNDGDLDLFRTNNDSPNQLLRNDGDDIFADVTSALLSVVNRGQACGWADVDLDGDLDLYVVGEGGRSSYLYRNDGHGVFANLTSGPLANVATGGMGMGWADHDGDGDPDLYVANDDGPNQLLRNDQVTGHHWLKLDLVGTISNASAIGARVIVVAGGSRQIREVAGGSSYLSQNAATVLFGLGEATTADSILVRWPSGGIDVLSGVSVDTTLTVVEGDVTPVMISGLMARETRDGIEISWYLARADAVNGLTVLRSVDGRESVPVNSGLLAPVQGETRILDDPAGLSPGATLVYRLMAIGQGGGAEEVPGEARLVYSDLTGRVNALAQNRPNPFNPRTVIPFNLAATGRATLRIYDVAGRVVRTLVDMELKPGTHQIAWDGTNEHGTPVSSGTYYYELRSTRFVRTRALQLLR